MAEWSVLPNGGKLPLLRFEELLARPLAELELAGLDAGTRALTRLVQTRKTRGDGPKDGRVRNFGTADIAKLVDGEWVFFPLALAKVDYDGGDDEYSIRVHRRRQEFQHKLGGQLMFIRKAKCLQHWTHNPRRWLNELFGRHLVLDSLAVPLEARLPSSDVLNRCRQ